MTKVPARLLAGGLIVAAVALLAWLLLFSGGSDYRVKLTLENASQLVKGNQVKVGGVPVGSVESIGLADDGRTRVEIAIDDDGITPLKRGSRAEVRSASLSGVANRYVALTPGPVNAHGTIPSGGSIPAEDTSAEVDLDEVLNTLDPETLRDLKLLTRNGASALSGRGAAFGRAIEALDPALSRTAALEREILRDQGTFARFLVESADVVSAVAQRPPALERMVGSGRVTLETLADRDAQLDSLLRRAPDTLRRANTTLVNLRATLVDARPTLRAARPVAAPLAEFLKRLRPVARDARPVVTRLRHTIDRPGSTIDLLGVLAGVPALERKAVPAFVSAVKTADSGLPIVEELRAYTPDVIGGQLNGFGGNTSGYFDANGHYTRISFQSSAYSATGIPSLLSPPALQSGLVGFRKGVTNRCPGAAAQSAPDGSNPIVIDGVCKKEDSPR